MAEVVHDVQQEYWRPPVALASAGEIVVPVAPPTMAEVCTHCSTEFMIGSSFCHACGAHRPLNGFAASSVGRNTRTFVKGKIDWLQSATLNLSRHPFKFPAWLRYLHFHEIKRWVGLPTPSLIAFMIGLGCVVGAIGVSVFYKASNLAEFQAIQMWRVEWLLGATASFVAGILLKNPPSNDPK
jgi:hypothetical protein